MEQKRKVLYEVLEPKSLEDMTWAEVAEIVAKTKLAIIPLGAVEQHGYHLPLLSDTLIALEIAKRVSLVLAEEGKSILVGPSIPFGVNPEAMAYPGSITIRPDTLKNLIKDVVVSLAAHGFSQFILLMGHDGNIPAMEVAVQELTTDHGFDVACVNWLVASKDEQKRIVGVTGPDGHGGAGETSRVLAICPNLVHQDKAIPYIPKSSGSDPVPYSGSPVIGGGVYHPLKNSRFGQSPPKFPGQIGDPRLGSAQAGEKIYQMLSNWLAAVIKQEFFS